MEEIFKDIDGFEGYYQISNKGRVKSLSRKVNHSTLAQITIKEKILNLTIGTHGYYSVTLRKNGKVKTFTIHRLIAIYFIPNPENHKIINHKNGNKLDNSIDNIEWCSYSHNIKHAYNTGLRSSSFTGKTGYKHHRSKPVLMSLNGVPVKVFDSVQTASNKLGLCRSTISSSAKNNRTAYGYQWSFF